MTQIRGILHQNCGMKFVLVLCFFVYPAVYPEVSLSSLEGFAHHMDSFGCVSGRIFPAK